jgi:hypothetical protein
MLSYPVQLASDWLVNHGHTKWYNPRLVPVIRK